jgi:hypothetical protein
MRDYDAEAEYINEEFNNGNIDTEDQENYLRQLDEERSQEAREMFEDEDEHQ